MMGVIPEADRAAGQDALDRLGRLLAERPHETFEEMTLAVRGIVRVRDALIARRRSGGADGVEARLTEVNKLVTAAIGAQFPMAGMQWDRVEKMRDDLRAVLGGL